MALCKWSFSQMEYFHSVYIPLERVFPTSDWTSTVNHRNVWLSETRCHHVTKKVNYPYHSNANTSAPHFRGAWSPLFDDLLVQRTSELKISMLRASEKQNLENDDKPQRDIKVATRTKLPVSSRWDMQCRVGEPIYQSTSGVSTFLSCFTEQSELLLSNKPEVCQTFSSFP